MPDLLTILRSRGLVHDATPGLPERLASTEPVSAYVGFDPTASSLHVGNLVPVMALSWLQRLGGLPIVVVGGGTGLVGDPSGKRGERPMLSVEEIDANVAALRKQLSRFLAFDGPAAARMVDNATWLRPLLLMEFLRDTGKHFTVNYMLQKESVSARMETGISFTEFAYMLVQAYDFHHLFTTEHCDLQMGGSDQWGNITAGIELIARRAGGKAHGLVCPLLTTSSGGKFGKSEGENIWLDPSRTSPYRFYQFWLNTDDRDVERFLRIFTFLPLEEIEGLKQQHASNAGQRIPHRALADDLTDRVHGRDARQRVVAASAILFGGGSPREADAETLQEVAQEVGIRDVGRRINEGIPIVDALVEAQLATSKSDAMRGLKAGGFSVNGEKVQPDRVLIRSDLLAGGYILLQKGKKNYMMLHSSS